MKAFLNTKWIPTESNGPENWPSTLWQTVTARTISKMNTGSRRHPPLGRLDFLVLLC